MLLDTLAERQIGHALIGGLAMTAHGLARTTFDLDIAIDGERQDEVVSFLESSGYETLHRSSGYSNHLHQEPALGRIDIVYLRGETREAIMREACWLPGPEGRLVPVVKPEHLAAMKVVAMKHDPTRTFSELADIRFLLTLPGVDRAEIESYFTKHGLEERFRELAATL